VSIASLEQMLDADRYGGKAAQLAAAFRAGLPVPRGVALSVDVVEAVAAGDPAAPAELERAWSLLRPPLAVRSSAVGEDSETTSFAGQHLTTLNVCRAADALAAVEAVWRSGHAESALAYRRRLGVAGTPRIGAVLQELIDADCGRPLHPQSSGRRGRARRGSRLGPRRSGRPAGLVTPDRFRITRDGIVVERVVGEKDVAVVLAPEGGTHEIAVSVERVRRLCLDDRQLAELASLAELCERSFGGGRDLEWAFADGALYLLQCRALTRSTSLIF